MVVASTPSRFFNEADFDITANIESALADISFSAIDAPSADNLLDSSNIIGKSTEYAVYHFSVRSLV